MTEGGTMGDDLRIAIIGMSGRWPGSRNLDEFWENLAAGECAMRELDADELEFSMAQVQVPGNPFFVKNIAVLEDVDLFDAPFFGVRDDEAELMDPQHRFFLQCAWEAFEAAGYDPHRFDGRVGLYTGQSLSQYMMYMPSYLLGGSTEDQLRLGLWNDRDYLPLLVSHKLDLRGPSVVVQSACSSSLIATHLACQSLISGESDMALAGGVCVRCPQKAGYMHEEGGMLSSDGFCRAFDAEGKGMAFSSGAGVVLLKRLEAALADGDPVRAVIRGSAVNNDGSKKITFSAPREETQAEVILEALAISGVDPDTVSYVEAHGTGTPLGDPMEFGALTKAFRASTDRNGFCGLGSVKSNIGHTDTAAGVTGLIKTVLSLEHEEIPPSLHYGKAKPGIDFENSPFFLNATLRPWKRSAEPRRAGVNAFGIGGSNAHVVVEEAPQLEPGDSTGSQALLVLSAMSDSALEVVSEKLRAHLEAHPDLCLADVAYTLQQGRRPLPCRRALVCADVAEALTLLEGAAGATSPDEASAPIAFAFSDGELPGGAALEELLQGSPRFGLHLDDGLARLATVLQREGRGGAADTLREALLGGSEPDAALRPALCLIVQVAVARTWLDLGVKPDSVLAEGAIRWGAACLRGELSLDEAIVRSLAGAEERAEGVVASSAPPREQTLRVDLGVAAERDWLETLGRLWCAGVDIAWEAPSADERRRRVPLPTYPFEGRSYWFERGYKSPRPRLVRPGRRSERLFAPTWKRSTLPRVTGTRSQEAFRVPWLVLEDEHGLGAELAARIRAQEGDVVTVTRGDAFRRTGDDSFTIDPREPGDYVKLLESVQDAVGSPGRIVSFWNTAGAASEAVVARAEEDFFELVFLTQALDRVGTGEAGAKLVVVASEVFLVTGEESPRPEGATALGPCAALAHELPALRAQFLDVVLPAGGERLGALAARVLAEAASDATGVVALRGAHRWVPAHEEVAPSDAASEAPQLRADGAYLIAGGTGFVGVEIARWLAGALPGAKLALLARSDSLDPDVRRGLETLGAEVLVLRADLSRREELESALAETVARFGAIRGVIHAAGSPGGEPVAKLERESARAALDARVRGAFELVRLLDERGADLDFFVSCVSVAPSLDLAQPAAVAAGEGFLRALADGGAPSCASRSLAVGFEPWDEAEAVRAAEPSALAEGPRVGTSIDDALRGLGRALARGRHAQLSVTRHDLIENANTF